jgi:hypothetical protein
MRHLGAKSVDSRTLRIRMRLKEKVEYFRPNNNIATLRVMRPLSVLFLACRMNWRSVC